VRHCEFIKKNQRVGISGIITFYADNYSKFINTVCKKFLNVETVVTFICHCAIDGRCAEEHMWISERCNKSKQLQRDGLNKVCILRKILGPKKEEVKKGDGESNSM
jgi:hypothetical protein